MAGGWALCAGFCVFSLHPSIYISCLFVLYARQSALRPLRGTITACSKTDGRTDGWRKYDNGNRLGEHNAACARHAASQPASHGEQTIAGAYLAAAALQSPSDAGQSCVCIHSICYFYTGQLENRKTVLQPAHKRVCCRPHSSLSYASSSPFLFSLPH